MWEQIRANQRRSVILVIVMAVLLFATGWFFGVAFMGDGIPGLLGAFIVWIILTLIAYAQGDSIFLGVSGARKIGPDDHPILWNVVEEMKIASGMSRMPDIYIIDDPTPNAFATGRSEEKAAVAVTAGLLERLNRSELQGVIAHEMGHIRNRDVLYMMMIGIMVGAIALLADIGMRMLWFGGMGRSRSSSRSSGAGGAQAIMMIIAIVLMILAPIIAQIIYFAVSRKREYLADASGAIFTRYPEALASALEKISAQPQKLKNANRVVAPSYIINPTMAAKGKAKASLFSTHPPTAERIRILRAMGGAGFGDYDAAYREVTGKPVGVIPFQTLQKAEKVAIEKQGDGEYDTKVKRRRQTMDAMWKLNNFGFINCECGTKLKIPPALLGSRIACPHCGREYDTSSMTSG